MSDAEAFHFFPGKIACFNRQELFTRALSPLEGSFELVNLRYRNFESTMKIFKKLEYGLFKSVHIERAQLLLQRLQAIQRKAAQENSAFVHLLLFPTERHLNEVPVLLKYVKKRSLHSDFAFVRICPGLHCNAGEIQQEIAIVLLRFLLKHKLVNTIPEHLSFELIIATLENCERGKNMLLVILLEEAHVFPEALLKEFSSFCSGLSARIKTAIVALYASEFPYKNLCITSFPFDCMNITVCPLTTDQNAANILSMELALSTDILFKLNAETVGYLFRRCSRSQPLSAADFCRLYIYCMVEHFRCNEASMQCVTASTLEEAGRILQKKFAKCRKEDKRGTSNIGQDSFDAAYEEYMLLHRNFFFGLEALSILNKRLLGQPFGSSFNDMYSLMQSAGFVGSKEWNECFLSLTGLEMGKFDDNFQELLQLIENNKPMSSELELALNEWRQSRTKPMEGGEKAVKESFNEKKFSLRKLQEEIQLTRLSACKMQLSQEKKALTSLSDAFCSLLQHPSTLSLYPASYYDGCTSLSSKLEPSISRTLEDRILESVSSDASIIFSLYRNHPCDSLRVSSWFSEFQNGLKDRKRESMDVLLARFYRVLADFEYIGLISPYRRKGEQEPAMREFIPNLTDNNVSAALRKLTFFSLAVIVVPLSSMFISKRYIFEGIFGISSNHSITMSAVVAVLLVHVVLVAFVYSAMSEGSQKTHKQTEPCTPDGDAAVAKVSELCKQQCELCGIHAPNVCGKCHCVRYCSKEHQRLHWSLGHKQECNATERAVLTNTLLFPEYEIITEGEHFFETSKSERPTEKRMEAYRQYMTSMDSSAAKGDFKTYGMEELESMSKEADKDFKRFRTRIEQNPEQVIRYQRGGQPLFASQANPPIVPACESCGADRHFEFQIMPHLLTYMGLDTVEALGVDWATICVYTCSANCDGARLRYLKEYTWKQDYNP
uniref:MYND-type domain-containing protein n=1 Tax=Trichuris muris TaxID=70415 RepID=A0A5S6QRM1_TRIMR